MFQSPGMLGLYKYSIRRENADGSVIKLCIIIYK
jgi:hypothetical protein